MNEHVNEVEESQHRDVEEVPEQLTVEAPDGTEQSFAPVTEIIHHEQEEVQEQEEEMIPIYDDGEYDEMLIEEMDPSNPYGIEEDDSDPTAMLGTVILALGGIMLVSVLVYIISRFV